MFGKREANLLVVDFLEGELSPRQLLEETRKVIRKKNGTTSRGDQKESRADLP
jgi:hypothetical protein